MHKAIQYVLILVSLIVFTSPAMADAFDQTVDEIKTLETGLEQNQIDIEEKQTFIEEELKTFRANHALNAAKGEFESDADYAKRLNTLNALVEQRRTELEEEHLSSLQVRRQEIQDEISRLYRRVFVTTDVNVILGRYNANSEYFPITFEVNNQSVNVRLYISRHNDAPILKENWDKVVKKAYISINPGYKRGIAYVRLEYPPLWNVRIWRFYEVYHLGRDNRAVDFSSDGKYIATGGEAGYASIWEASSGRELRQIKHHGTVYAVAFSPDVKYLATGDSRFIRLLQVDNGKQLWSKYYPYRSLFSTYYAAIYAVNFSSDGKYLANANSRGMGLNEVISGRNFWGKSRNQSGFFTTYTANFHSVSFRQDGRYLVTGDSFNDAIIWNTQTGRVFRYIQHSHDVLDADFRPDGQYMATGDEGGNVSICEVSSGTKTHVLPHDGGWIGAVVFSPDGKYLAVGHKNNRITFYTIPQGKLDIDSKIQRVRTIYTIGSVHELAWHPNGSFISDGRKVYRTLLQTETVDLIPPPPTLHIDQIDPINAGTQFTLDLTIADAFGLTGWQLDITFNPAILSAVEVKEGNFLKASGGSTFFHRGNIDNTTGKITNLSSALIGGSGISGAGTLFSITFDPKAAGNSELQLINITLSNSSGETIPHELMIDPVIIEERLLAEDVNGDGVVNIQDLVLVASSFGQTGENNADVNGDGVVNIQDLVLVAAAFEGSASAPAIYSQATDLLAAYDVQQWLSEAQQLDLTDATLQQGILFLEQLLKALAPKETALLPNYPNPFNPETWVPYQLAEPADVSLSIYAADGRLVRTLALGYQPAGIYQSRTRAAYWDGRNELGESVASGIYFYTLTAGEYSATRKMLIRK